MIPVYTAKWFITIRLVTIHHLTVSILCVCVERTCKIYSLSNVQTHSAALFSGVVTTPNARSPFLPDLQLKRGPSDHSHRPLTSAVAFCRY